MKVSILLSLVALTRCAISGSFSLSDTPLLGHDPDAVEKCASWYNNAYGASCEYVRDNYDITPELFHAWNPSIGLDCAPWYYASYCILSQERLDEYNKEHPTSTTTSVAISTTATTTSAPTLGPSPTSWTALGCYIEYPAVPILQLNMNPTGDASLSVPKCQQSCYRRAYNFAGVQEGNQCWCGSYVGGEVAKNQTECNTPCTGDKSIFCGGKGRINIFKAEKNGVPPSSTGSQTQTSTTTTKPSTTQPSNGYVQSATVIPSCSNMYRSITTPLPALPSMYADCDAFYLVKDTDTCLSIAAFNRISHYSFIASIVALVLSLIIAL